MQNLVCISLYVFKDDYITWGQALYKEKSNVIIMSRLLTNHITEC